MNYCSNCGAETLNNAIVCIKCGCSIIDQNLHHKKPKSYGKAIFIGIIIGIILIPLFFIFTTSIITYNILSRRDNYQETSDSSIDYSDSYLQYATFSLIGQLNTRTRDRLHSVVVDMLIEYDNNNASLTELMGRVDQLRDFTRQYFSNKYHDELRPENEENIKLEIIEYLNTRFFDSAIVHRIIFNRLDVIEL